MNRDELAAIMRDNPDIEIDLGTSVISGDLDLKGSDAENRFYEAWLRMDGPDLAHDAVQPVPDRNFRLDFAREDVKIGIEIQGGVWKRTGHAHPVKYQKDCEKINLAQLYGWQVYLFTPQMIDSKPELIRRLIDYMEEKLHAKYAGS